MCIIIIITFCAHTHTQNYFHSHFLASSVLAVITGSPDDRGKETWWFCWSDNVTDRILLLTMNPASRHWNQILMSLAELQNYYVLSPSPKRLHSHIPLAGSCKGVFKRFSLNLAGLWTTVTEIIISTLGLVVLKMVNWRPFFQPDFCYTHINISKTTLNSQMLEQLMEHVWYIMPRLCHTLFPYLKNLLWI